MPDPTLIPACIRCLRRDYGIRGLFRGVCWPCLNAIIAEQDGTYDPELEAENETYARFGPIGGRAEWER